MANVAVDSYWLASAGRWILTVEQPDWAYGSGITLDQAYARLCAALGGDPRDKPESPAE
jgi:hypothetical protein